jgi:hypothetical protein
VEKISEDKKTSLQNQNRRQNVKERTEDISKTSLVSRAIAKSVHACERIANRGTFSIQQHPVHDN